MAAKKYEIFNINRMDEIASSPSHEVMVYLAAIAYVEAGFSVLPIVKNGKAIPPKKYKVGYNTASRSKAIVEKWFNPIDGIFVGWNIGLATGKEDGIFVVDVDNHGETNGFETLKEMNVEFPVGPMQLTPTGGRHYIYAWEENAMSSVNKIGVGIDTRGGSHNACRGHIVAFPSIIDGNQYVWQEAGALPSIPKWVMNGIGVAWKQKPKEYLSGGGNGRGNENVGDPDIEETVPMEQLKRMLTFINPDDKSYDDWVRIGMAIKSQYPDDDGLEAWDSWSSQGKRYEDRECRSRWSSFGAGGAIRMATIFWFAHKGGYETTSTETKSNKLGTITERYNDTCAVVSVGGKVKILEEKPKDRKNPMGAGYSLFGRQDFSTLQANDQLWLPDAKKPIQCFDVWMADGDRRTYRGGIGLYPNEEDLPDETYNTWRGFATEPEEGDCTLFKQHILEVVCGNVKEHYNFVLDWCADLFTDPSNPKGVALVMRGEEGIGKGMFADTIGKMCAPHYVHLIDESHLTGNFNGHLAEAIVVFADEITWGGNQKTAGKLKGLVTEDRIVIERKGIDAVDGRNMCHVMIASNSDWVVPAGRSSRRWFALDVSSKYRSNTRYFNALANEIDNGGKEAFMFEMMKRKITSTLNASPVTKMLVEQRTLSASSTDNVSAWWQRVLLEEVLLCEDAKDENNVGWAEYVYKTELYRVYEEYCTARRLPITNINTFYKKVVDYGMKKERVSSPDGRKKEAFRIKSVETMKKAMSDYLGWDAFNDGDENEE